MDARGYKKISAVKNNFKKNGLVQKTVAIFVTVLFIFSGIPVLASFAGDATPITLNEVQQPVSTVTLEQANAQTNPAQNPVPSGSAIQTASPLTALDNTSPVPEGWMRAASNSNYAYKTETHPDGSPTEYLVIMDLRTGQGVTIASADPRQGEQGFVFVDVTSASTPRGAVVVYEVINPTAGISLTTIQRIDQYGEQYSFEIDRSHYVGNPGGFNNGIVSGFTLTDSTLIIQREDGRETWIDASSLSLVPPSGWTRAASNANFAFTTKFMGTVSLRDYMLCLKDLVTGEETVLEDRGNYYTKVGYPALDVSPSGRYVIYGIEEDLNSPDGASFVQTTRIVDRQDSSRVLTLKGVAQVISFTEGGAVALVKIGDVEYRLALATFTFQLSSGWTRSVSNKGFAFHVKSEKVGSYTVDTLQLMDLRTGEIRDVVKTQPPAIPTFSRYDVSADGNAVIYEMYGYMQVQKISDPSTKWVGGGIPKSISTNGHLVIFIYPDGTRISIDTQTFKQVPAPIPSGQFQAGGCLVADQSTSVSSTSCVGFAGTPNGTVEIHTYNSKGNTGVTIYDAQQQQILSYTIASMSSAITQPTVSPDGKYLTVVGQLNRVSIVSLTVPASQQSVLIPQATGFGAPAVNEVKFISPTRILVTMKDGSGRQFYVDIKPDGTLALVPVAPIGWTRAASNVNFAFQVQTNGLRQVLVTKNLLTGQNTVVTTTLPSFKIGSMYDMAPDGKTVVYSITGPKGYAGATIVQNISNPAKQATVAGVATAIQFVNGQWVLTINGRIIKVDPVTLGIVR